MIKKNNFGRTLFARGQSGAVAILVAILLAVFLMFAALATFSNTMDLTAVTDTHVVIHGTQRNGAASISTAEINGRACLGVTPGCRPLRPLKCIATKGRYA